MRLCRLGVKDAFILILFIGIDLHYEPQQMICRWATVASRWVRRRKYIPFGLLSPRALRRP
ncbi:hypothetical protein C9424_00165 [Arthrobacter sp. H-02-3]|nr:hypothetical protein C9424_00165 [Arthrobacter sp. H-02-3]